jgi:hypothetical protein
VLTFGDYFDLLLGPTRFAARGVKDSLDKISTGDEAAITNRRPDPWHLRRARVKENVLHAGVAER